MNKTIFIFSLGLVLAAVPLVHADETKADCEDHVTWTDEAGRDHTSDQGWIGYAQTDSLRGLYGTLGSPGSMRNCEGEQWDGQDSVQPGLNNNNGAGCSTPEVDSGGVNTVSWCMAADPNSGGADPLTNGRPVSIRVSQTTDSSGAIQVYVASDIALVGRAAVYQGACKAGSSGLEGDSSCNGPNAQDRTAVYLRDNTPGDVLATAVSALGLTKGNAGEADCTQSTYQHGAETQDKSLCQRDNTAITLDLLP